MKTTAPFVPLAVWRSLYEAAGTFFARRPWEVLDDLDLFGVRDSATGETGYGVVMGSGGMLMGLCLYRGAEGLAMYRRLIGGDFDPEDEAFFAAQNCLTLEFGTRRNLQREDHAVIRELGLSFRGRQAWPEFRSYLPGYAPWFLTEQEARFLTHALSAACHHSNRITRGDIDRPIRENKCLTYSIDPDAPEHFIAQWEPFPPTKPVHPPILNLARINAVRSLSLQPDSPWEADVFYLPSMILEHERPYFMRVAAVCQQSSGLAIAAEVSPPEPTVPQLLADSICSAVERHRFLPDTIFVKRKEDAAVLAPLSRAIGVRIRPRKNLRAVRQLNNEMTAYLKHTQRKKR